VQGGALEREDRLELRQPQATLEQVVGQPSPELDHDLDVVLLARERLAPAVERDAARYQALEPRVVGLRERLRGPS
jgi:hypothetical protein